MQLVITEKQLKRLRSQIVTDQSVIEQESDPSAAAPESGVSSDGEKKTGATKWESGVTRGKANPIGSDGVWVSGVTRGKANPLSEQGSFEISFNRRYGTAAAAEKSNRENRELVQGVVDFYKKYNHEVNTVLGIGAFFIPYVGPAISSGIALMDAAQYYKEGDTKMAGMVGMFSILPGVGTVVSKIPGVKTLGAKGMAELAKKLTLGTKITNPTEIEVVTQIAKYKNLIKAEMEKIGKDATIAAARKGVQKNIVKKNVANKAVGAGTSLLGYGGLGVAYSMGYDKLTGAPKKDMAKLTKDTPSVYKIDNMVQLPDGSWEIKD